MDFKVILLDKTAGKYKNPVEKIIKKLHVFFKEKGVIEVYLVGARRMRFLNKKFRGKNKSTNVLSFKNPDGFPGNNLGEVFLDPIYIHKQHTNSALSDFVLQQCKRAHANKNKKCALAFAYMTIHGVLHILGYDHEKNSDRIEMEHEEVRLLRRISNS